MSDLLIPEPVVEACRQLANLRTELYLDKEVQNAQTQIARLELLMRDARTALTKVEAPFIEKMKPIEEYIVSHALEIGQSFEHDEVKVKVTAGYETTSLLKKDLDTMKHLDGDLYEKIKTYLTVKSIEPRVSIG